MKHRKRSRRNDPGKRLGGSKCFSVLHQTKAWVTVFQTVKTRLPESVHVHDVFVCNSFFRKLHKSSQLSIQETLSKTEKPKAVFWSVWKRHVSMSWKNFHQPERSPASSQWQRSSAWKISADSYRTTDKQGKMKESSEALGFPKMRTFGNVKRRTHKDLAVSRLYV